MKTTLAKPHEVERKWYVIDAEGQNLGRMATQVATILRGKHKPIYTPHVDTGDFVIVINAEKIQLTGKKLDQKLYRHHSQHPGGMKEVKYRDLLRDKPEFAIQNAVKGMLPKNVMGRQMLSKLKVYQGTEHPHEAQNPVPYKG